MCDQMHVLLTSCVFMLQLMVGPAKTLFMDEISTGLDSSTTYLIVRCIRNYVHLLDVSVTLLLIWARICACCYAHKTMHAAWWWCLRLV
jgi:ABC-type phosphonate transport system ATPase subunit